MSPTVDLGTNGSVAITKEDTIILNGEGLKDAIQSCCKQTHSLIADPTPSNFDRTKLQEHLVKLSGGIAVIKVGGSYKCTVGLPIFLHCIY
jgi:chaperonin GroEL